LADQIIVPESGLVRIPDHLTYAQAATLPCAAVTAWGALFERGRPLRAGDILLVQGTGGVALFGLQFAKAVGARVVVLSSSDDKLARVKALGADFGINYRSTPEWARAVREVTGGHVVSDQAGALCIHPGAGSGPVLPAAFALVKGRAYRFACHAAGPPNFGTERAIGTNPGRPSIRWVQSRICG